MLFFLEVVWNILKNPINSFLVGVLGASFTLVRLALHFYERTQTYSLKEARNFIVVAVLICTGWSMIELTILGQSAETWKSIALTYLVTGAIVVGHYIAIVIIQLLPDPLQRIEDLINKYIKKEEVKEKVQECNEPCAEEKTLAIIQEVFQERKEDIKNIMGLL